MTVYDDIEQMSIRISRHEYQTVKNRINLYSKGVGAKLKEAEYALKQLRDLAPLSINPGVLINAEENQEKLHFYVDSFFAFVYSTFDVIAQVINQKMHMGINENDVKIGKIKNELDNNHRGTPLQSCIQTLYNRRYFKNLKRYRNCSTHRRQIYIEEKVRGRTETEGYNMSGLIPSAYLDVKKNFM